jgi:hypothetical protein
MLEDRTLLSSITGFNNGNGWTANPSGSPPTLSTTTLTLTTTGGQDTSAFYNTSQFISKWTAAFTYQPTLVKGFVLADGVTFMLQNAGPTALGGGGSGLGMSGISPSAEVEFNVYNAHVIGTAFEINGANSQIYMSTAPVNLASGDPIAVTLNYNGTQLSEVLRDTTTGQVFSTSYTTNLINVLGGKALVGFTGATGDGAALQTITNFSFTGTSTTSTKVTSSVNPSTFGQSVTFTANVSSPAGSPPAGETVNFSDGGTPLGSGTLDGSGNATFTTSTLALGAHPITATYVGDADFGSSTSAVLPQSVGQASTTTTLGASPNPGTFGQPVTLTATVSGPGGTPTGTVNFLDGAAPLGSGTLNSSGTATFTTSTLDVAHSPHSLIAVYQGDPNYTGSTSSPFSEAIVAGTSTTLNSSLNPSTFSQTITFTATVNSAAGTPAGTVNFLDGTTTIASGVPLNGAGVAIFGTSTLSPGTHQITAMYQGNATYFSSTSLPLPQVVNQLPTAAAIVSNLNPSIYTQTVGFTATITSAAGIPSGTVNFLDGNIILGSSAVSGTGLATFSTSALNAGTHAISAAFLGSTNYAPSNSAAVFQVVSQAGTTTTLTSSANPSTFTQSVTFTATVTSPYGAAQGSVNFLDGTTVLGSGLLNASGVASFSTSALTAGTHPIRPPIRAARTSLSAPRRRWPSSSTPCPP